jgi:predicted Ser/Thr protein kinase
MIDNREILRSEFQKIYEQIVINRKIYIFDYHLARFLTQEEIENGVVFNYDLESQEEAN